MNTGDAQQLELIALCDALADGIIDQRGHERLSRMLLESADARRLYVQYMALSASLCHYAAELQTDAPEAKPLPARIIRHPASWWTFGAIAAMALIFLAVSRNRAGENDETALDTNRFVAVLVQTKDCRWAPGTTPPKTGDHLGRGQSIVIASGLAEIAFDCGAVLIIEGPAALDLDSAWAATLRHGTLRAKVPPEAIGFRVSNPAVEVIDLGTEFSLVADAEGTAEVLVHKGSVEAAAEGGTIILREKEGRRFAKTGPTDVGDRERKIERLSQRLRLDVPPAPLAYAHWSFDDSVGGVTMGRMVGMDGIHPAARIEPKGAEWRTDGRWGSALRLDGKLSATASLPGTAKNARRTVAFWTRIPQDASLSGGQTILAWGERVKGGKTGKPITLLGWNSRPGQGTVGAFRAERGPDAVVGTTPIRDGVWHHVAATFVPAGRSRKLLNVRLYVDGRLEPTTFSKPKTASRPPIVADAIEQLTAIESLWIGRAPGGRHRGERFHGEIDELFVSDRALTAQEIRRLMKTNDPRSSKDDIAGGPGAGPPSL